MEFVDRLYPATFLELLGGVLAVVAVAAGLASLIFDSRIHLLKLLSITFICSLALFSNNVTTYFVAIFVIATAVTELDFLQNLAAIIRGNDGYFNYKKEALSRESKLGNVAADVAQADMVSSSGLEVPDEKPANSGGADASDSEGPAPQDLVNDPIDNARNKETNELPDVSSQRPKDVMMLEGVSSGENSFSVRKDSFSDSRRIKRVLDLEDKAFDKLEISHKTAIERGVRLVSKTGRRVDLDGLITANHHIDTIFETKYIRSPRNFIAWLKMVSLQLESLRNNYREITHKDAEIHFVLILEDGVALSERQRHELSTLTAEHVSIFTAGYLMGKD